MTSLFNLSSEIVVVTGGVGQLGSSFVRSLAIAGARVVAIDIDCSNDRVAGRFDDLISLDRIRLVESDVTSKSSVEEALSCIRLMWGVPTALVNCAALDSPPGTGSLQNGPFEEYDLALFESVMRVNVRGAVVCCQVFGGEMAKAGQGAIVNIASTYGLVSPDQRIYDYLAAEGPVFFKPVSYSVSKSAILNLTRYLATYWAKKGVRVNTLSFGGVFNEQDPQFVAGYEARVPMGRMARTGEYDGPVQFLLSKAASYVTGANLVVDGGWTAW